MHNTASAAKRAHGLQSKGVGGFAIKVIADSPIGRMSVSESLGPMVIPSIDKVIINHYITAHALIANPLRLVATVCS